jgi:hypothetical protein
MVDMSAIAGLATSLRAVAEITKAMKDVNDANLIQTKVFELTREIMAAQACALAAQTAQSDLLQRERDLETEIAKLRAWEAEAARYQLQELPPGVFVWTLRQAMANGEPIHRLCAKCYEDGKKSILQSLGTIHGQENLKCHGCDSTLKIGVYQPPMGPASARPSWGASRRG